MAALATQNLAAGGAYTLAAATAGGDTIESSTSPGGYTIPILAIFSVGITATTITLDGTAFGPYTSQSVALLVPNGVRGSRKSITYSQVSAVTVGAVGLLTAGYATFGT